ncbi:hypothetical protein Q1695_000694 [Nippostrongylus brasiliensis]|nr:hypothetical protein Q1695_000694 [Nippostrongylus brasiliensis]
MSSTLRASHLASMQHAVGDQPSIFDIISQESLMTSLKPAMGHLVKFLAMVYSQRFQTAHRYYDELYCLFDLLLQNQYLKKYGASFSENFYGMKRIFRSTGKSPTEFSARIRSLMLLVLWPYIRDKFEKWHTEWSDRLRYTSAASKDLRVRLGRIFVRLWPWVKRLLTIATTILQLGYILNRTTVHSPFLLLAGVRLEKLTAEDIEAFDKIPMHLQSAGLINRLWRFFLSLPGVFSRLFGYGLFFVQFIDFVYNSDLGSQLSKKHANVRVPPAPHKLLTESNVQLLDTNKCPLCLQRRRNDTALSVSGYVFCYSCIDSHVKSFKTCPVTGLPASTNELIRLYIQ